MTHSFTETTELYNAATCLKVSTTLVSHDLFRLYDEHVKDLTRRLKDVVDVDEYANRLLGALRNFSYAFSGIPLPFGHPGVFSDELITDLRRRHELASFPSSEDRTVAENAVKLLEDLVLLCRNPLLHELKQRVGEKEVALLIAKTRHLKTLVEYLGEKLPRVRLLTPASLRKIQPIENLFLLGSPDWYPESVFSAPRYSEIHVICYQWKYRNWTPNKLFGVELEQDSSLLVRQLETLNRWSGAITRFALSDSSHDYHDEVKGRLYVLEGDQGVLLEDDESAKVYVVEPENGELTGSGPSVDRISANTLEPGMFVLLRVAGTSDYVVDVADELMGKDSEMRRAKQEHWKGLLRSKIREHGTDSLVRTLRDAGCSKANKINLQNWANARNIKTSIYNDFSAIMRILGLSERTNDYWENAEKIDSAHRSAGFQIKNRLLERVKSADLSMLNDLGYMEFELPIAGKASGKLGAFRILSISSEIHDVPYNKIAQPFILEENEWLV